MKKKVAITETDEERKENEKFLILLGKRIRDLRKKKGMNQTELAVLMNNRDRQVVQRLEMGRTNCSIGLLRLTAKALDVDIRELFDFKGKL